MGGGHGADAPIMQMGQNGDGQGRALGGVGSGAELVEKHQRIVQSSLVQEYETMLVMWEEKVLKDLLDALLIADIGKHVVERRPVRLRSGGGNVESGLAHQGQKADGFQGDGLTAGIGTGDDQQVEACRQVTG